MLPIADHASTEGALDRVLVHVEEARLGELRRRDYLHLRPLVPVEEVGDQSQAFVLHHLEEVLHGEGARRAAQVAAIGGGGGGPRGGGRL